MHILDINTTFRHFRCFVYHYHWDFTLYIKITPIDPFVKKCFVQNGEKTQTNCNYLHMFREVIIYIFGHAVNTISCFHMEHK